MTLVKRFMVNIGRPYPDTCKGNKGDFPFMGQNKRLCEYIEPLRKEGRVEVSEAYLYNLSNLENGKECGYGPGYKYNFWFTNREDAEQFVVDWDELAYKRMFWKLTSEQQIQYLTPEQIEIGKKSDEKIKSYLTEVNEVEVERDDN